MNPNSSQQSSMKFVGHRGYPTRFPENTIIGFEAAVDAGALYIECDVRLSADAKAVLYHDDDLRRVSGIAGAVSGFKLSELTEFHAGYPERFGEKFADVQIAQLEEFCARLSTWSGVRAFVEIKVDCITQFGADRVFESISESLSAVSDQSILISFDRHFLAYVKSRTNWTVGWVISTWDQESQQHANDLQPEFLFSDYKLLSTKPLWVGPWQWAVYTVHDVQQAIQLAQRGVQLIETDDIGRMLKDTRLG